MDCSVQTKIDGTPVRVEGAPGTFAVDADEDCVLIGVMSQQSQAKSDMHGGNNLKIQRGTHSVPCSFNDVIELFGPDVSKRRIIDANAAEFESENQFVIPRTGVKGFIVEAKLDLPNVAVDGLKGKYDVRLLTLIATEAVAGVSQPKETIN